jgi:RNA polymerase sigma factor (sigma-70 family)
VNAARNGDVTALDEFAGRYRPAVVAYLTQRGLRHEDAEDVAQDAFLRLLRPGGALARTDARLGRFRCLLKAVAQHALADHVARARALKRGGGAQPADLAVHELPSGEGGDAFDRAWLGHVVDVALRRLEAEHPRYHDVLRRTIDGTSHADIAAAVGCGEASVRNACHRGRQKLVAYIKAEVWAYAVDHEDYVDELAQLSVVLGHSLGGRGGRS